MTARRTAEVWRRTPVDNGNAARAMVTAMRRSATATATAMAAAAAAAAAKATAEGNS